MRGSASLLPGILVLLLTSQPLAQGTAPLTLLSREGRRVVPTTVANGRELIALDDVVALFQVTFREDALTGGLTVTYRNRTIVVSTSQPLASVSGRAVSLSGPAVRVGNRWSVPIDFLSSGLSLIYDGRIEFRRAGRLLVVGDLRVPRVSARFDRPGPPTQATIEIAPATRTSIVNEAGRLLIRLEADAIEPALPRAGAGLIEQIRLGEQPTTLVVILAGGAGPARATASDVDGMTRVSIDVAPEAPAADAPALRTSPVEVTDLPPLTRARPLLGTIVLDPGHGGEDAGARGQNGTEEKQLTLAVAQRVKTMIEMRLGVRVILTRTDDRVVSLNERAAIANNSKADLFLSLHVNAAPTRETSGAEVMYLRTDREVADIRRAEGEAVSLPVYGGTTRSVDVVQWDLAQVRHSDRSAALAEILETQLRGHVRMSPRPKRALPLRVLTSVNMPAALVEMAYLTNAEQERQMRSDAYQAALAQALFDAVLQFRTYLEEQLP